MQFKVYLSVPYYTGKDRTDLRCGLYFCILYVDIIKDNDYYIKSKL